MTVIRTLSKSDSNEQREQIRMKLEKEYKESNEGLHELVSGHQNDLEKVMNVGSITIDRICVISCYNFIGTFSVLVIFLLK